MQISSEGTIEDQFKNIVVIKPSAWFETRLKHVEEMVRSVGKVQMSNGPGSTGQSSPDAQAPGGTGFSGVY